MPWDDGEMGRGERDPLQDQSGGEKDRGAGDPGGVNEVKKEDICVMINGDEKEAGSYIKGEGEYS